MTCELHTQTWASCKACFDNAHTPSAKTLRDVATFVPGMPRGCPHCFGYDGSHTRQCPSLQGTQEASQLQAVVTGFESYVHDDAASNPAPVATDNKRPPCEDVPKPEVNGKWMGWMCPRCETVHAPFVRSCQCQP